MKKITFILLIAISLCSLLCSCGEAQTPSTIEGSLSPVNANGEIIAYNVEEAPGSMTYANAFNMNNEYYVYYFYLGTVSAVPLYTSTALEYRFDTNVTFSLSQLTAETLSNSISRATSVVRDREYTAGLSASVTRSLSLEAKSALLKAKANLSSSATLNANMQWTSNWGTTLTNATAATNTYLSQFEKGYQEEVTFCEANGFTRGHYYRLSFYDTVSAYGVLIYDVKDNSYAVANDFMLKNNSPVRMWEESSTPSFDYAQDQKLEFDINAAVSYAEMHRPEPITSKTDSSTSDTSDASVPTASTEHYVATTPLSCSLDNKYNHDQPSASATNKHFSHDFDFGQFAIRGCLAEDEANTYRLIAGMPSELAFRVEYDTDNLPLQDNMTYRAVSSDTKQAGFYQLPWNVGERDVKEGMIVALIEYEDGAPSDRVCLTDAFKDLKSGESVTIFSDIKKPCTITVAICYELVQWAPGFLGISDDYWTNWRINATFKFIA